MRIYGALILVILLAVATIFFLQSRQASEDVDALARVADTLQESGVQARSVDKDAAQRIINELELLVNDPTIIADNTEGLRRIAGIAASWAKAAPAPSPELHLAVSIRGASDELRSYALEPSPTFLERARKRLDEARKALLGEVDSASPTDGIRDRLDNLGQSQAEKYQELAEGGN